MDLINILLTGASGTVGRQVLCELLKRRKEFNITVFDVKSKKSEMILSKYDGDIEIIYGDISIEEDIKQVCNNKDVVIHLAAIIPPLADKNPQLAFNVNVIGTNNLVRNLELYSPNAFLIYSSSISVYGDRLESPWIVVGDRLNPSVGDEYAKTKIEAEKIIYSSLLCWTIFRFTAIMGIDNHKVNPLMFHMPLNTPLEIATPEDTGFALSKAIDNIPKLRNRIFNLSGDENCRIIYKDFLKKSFLAMGLGKFNLPNNAFAENNFHCAYYSDGSDLDNILNFRRDTIDTYFLKLRKSVKPLKRVVAYLLKGLIKRKILNTSEFYKRGM